MVALTQGSEVILDCGGGITVDGEPLEATLKHKQRFRRAGVTTGLWTTQRERENTGTAGTYNSETHQNQTAAGNRVEDQREAVATAKTPTVTTKKQMRRDFTISQPPQTNRVGGEGGGAFGVTMETGMARLLINILSLLARSDRILVLQLHRYMLPTVLTDEPAMGPG